MTAPVTACEIAQTRYFQAARWLNLWKVLLWIFGATVVIFCCLAIILFIRQTWLTGAITVLGTIVNGVGISWVVTQRTKAAEEEHDAYQEVIKECAPPARTEGPARAQAPAHAQQPPPMVQEMRARAWNSLFSRTPN